MKSKIENIDELFKQTFDGFEADVDPSVWSNIQSNIGAGTVSTAVVSKSIFLKVVVTVIALGALTTGAYLVLKETPIKEKKFAVNLPVGIEQTTKGNVIASQDKAKQNIENNLEEAIPVLKIEKRIEEKPLVEEFSKVDVVQYQEVKVQEVAIQEDAVLVMSSSNEDVASVEKVNHSEKKITEEISVEQQAVEEEVALENEENQEEDLDGDDSGLMEEEQLPIIYKEKIPKAFSPNGDGIGDIIAIEGDNIKEFQAKIFSASSGKVIFEWNWIEGFWDGRDKLGAKVPKGTYMLQVIASGEDGKPISVSQSVTVY